MRTPSRYIFRLPSHEINPFRATLLLILLICAVLAGVSWLMITVVKVCVTGGKTKAGKRVIR